MSKIITLVGRTTDFKGKSLWELLGNLKNYGVGRVVVRSMFERYPEKTFYRILSVETKDTPKLEDELKAVDRMRRMRVTVEKVFRGMKYEIPSVITSSSYKCDYRLLSKKEEKDYCQVIGTFSNDKKTISPEIDLPPLFKELLIKEGKTDLKMKTVINKGSKNKTFRVAKEGEKPTIELTIGLSKPASPSLYEGLKI